MKQMKQRSLTCIVLPWLLFGALCSRAESDSVSGAGRAYPNLAKLKRIHVENLKGGETAQQMHDMLIAALQATGQFQLTENPEKADAILRGSAEDLVFTDTFQTSENIQARVGVGSFNIGGSRSVRSGSANAAVGESESTRIQERKHEAMASVRLVNRDGDIVWSTTQESMGGKFRGASADVADKVVKRLIDDLRKAQAATAAPAPPTSSPAPTSAAKSVPPES